MVSIEVAWNGCVKQKKAESINMKKVLNKSEWKPI